MNSNFHRAIVNYIARLCKKFSREKYFFPERTHGEQAYVCTSAESARGVRARDARPFDQYAENEREGGAELRSVGDRRDSSLTTRY